MDKIEFFEALMEELEFSGEQRGPRKAVTFWLLPEEHAIYHELQERSNKRFGKSFERLLRKVIKAKKAA